MSEAIENMDAMNMNLKSRREAHQAAEKINTVLKKYNQKMLYDKAVRLEQAKSKLEEAQAAETEHKKRRNICCQKTEELESVLVQVENEWKEALYQWNGNNQELTLDKELLRELSNFADSYGESSDFATVRQKVADVWIYMKTKLEAALEKSKLEEETYQIGTVGGRILEQMIHRSLEQRNLLIEGTEIFPAYKRQKSFLAAGILLDDVSNYAMVCNVEAVKKDGTIHMGMDGFQKEKDMFQVPLGVISDWKEVRCQQQKIYIVENPFVFAMLCGKAECSCMCMNGQPRLAGLMLLDLLEKSGTTIYYSGDLDPEGILIAQKLADYYRGKFHFWHMDSEDYNKSRSEEVISDRRMKILDKITDVRLIPVVDEIKKYKIAGYQERIFV